MNPVPSHFPSLDEADGEQAERGEEPGEQVLLGHAVVDTLAEAHGIEELDRGCHVAHRPPRRGSKGGGRER